MCMRSCFKSGCVLAELKGFFSLFRVSIAYDIYIVNGMKSMVLMVVISGLTLVEPDLRQGLFAGLNQTVLKYI